MEHSKDFIEREIQKLTLMMINLINQISGANLNDFEIGIKATNEALKSQFDLTIGEILNMQNSTLIKKISDLQKVHIEKLVEILYEVIKKNNLIETEKIYNRNKLTEKTLLLIEHIAENSNTFSLKRLNLKNVLQHRI
jgi:hypothetical protein